MVPAGFWLDKPRAFHYLIVCLIVPLRPVREERLKLSSDLKLPSPP
jgi:hypothetical protein